MHIVICGRKKKIRRDALRFDRAIKLEFQGAKVSSDAGLFPYRDLDGAAQLTDSGPAELFGFCTGTNVQHADSEDSPDVLQTPPPE